eukprot:TRINITY_DN2931_c0_g1_i3.p1 TRINITY_DN2931_c0_g1~~TRINITY_DN2931_c0_g1_i3.p1  ORF type:complete len:181 (+),score=47.21 TRINITY_DN2931_c0_g1_i3:175-717(+)
MDDLELLAPPISSPSKKKKQKRVLSEAQGQIIREVWQKLQKTVDHYALILFLTVFELSPPARNLFWFVRDIEEPAPTNPMLQQHAVKAMNELQEYMSVLDDQVKLKQIEERIWALGNRHKKYGITSDETPIFRLAFMKTFQKAMGEEWVRVQEPFSDAYDIIEAIFVAGLEGRRYRPLTD